MGYLAAKLRVDFVLFFFRVFFFSFVCVLLTFSSLWPACCYVVSVSPAKLRKASAIVTEVAKNFMVKATLHCCLCESDGVGPPVIKSKPYRHKHKDK